MKLIKNLKYLLGLPIIFLLMGASDYQWTPVEVGYLTTNLKVTGRIIPQEDSRTIESARIQGRVTRILKKEGELVKEGTALFVVNSADCNSLIQEKQTAEKLGIQELKESALRREKQLGLRIEGGECQVIASHAGTLTKRQIELGGAFNVGDSLAIIVDIQKLLVELDVPERDLFQVKMNQKVTFELASNAEQKFTTTIQNILPFIDPATRTSKVRLLPITLPLGSTPDLLVFAEIVTGGEQPILRVPSSALVFSHDKQYVVKQSPDQPVAVPVEVLGEVEGTSSIRVGSEGDLNEGDLVASKGAIFLFRKLNPE
jgi:membrane fusion protein, copper/silver efflux system